MTTTAAADPFELLASVAEELGVADVASDVRAARARVAERRFFLACVGQFKRGKSTLLDALLGTSVLPVGVVPVTAVVTVVRWGERLAARIRPRDGDWREIDPGELASYVSEAENPENEKGIAAVEVLVPAEILREGLCLVDTPGVGSVFAGNTEATREFVPQIDAALVVLGADPPISGAEIELVEDVARTALEIVFVLNKADKLDDAERGEAISFIAGVLAKRLARPAPSILEVSALERLRDGRAARDWDRLVATLGSLAHDKRAELVRGAADRALGRARGRLLREIAELRDALERPQEESARRVLALRAAAVEAERLLSDSAYLFDAVQDRLTRTFDAERDAFLKEAGERAAAELDDIVERAVEEDRAGAGKRVMDGAAEIARRHVEGWRMRNAPIAEQRYAEAVARFVAIANELLRKVADPNDPALAALPRDFAPDVGFRTPPKFFFTELLTLAGVSVGARVRGFVGGRDARKKALLHEASEYMARLLETNGSRAANDFTEQVRESRRKLQTDLRDHLGRVTSSAERALAMANDKRQRGQAAIDEELARLDALERAVRGAGAAP